MTKLNKEGTKSISVPSRYKLLRRLSEQGDVTDVYEALTVGVFTLYFPYIDSLLCHHLSIYISVPANVYIIANEDQFTPAVVDNQFVLYHLVIDTREEDLVVVLSLYISSTRRSVLIWLEHIREQQLTGRFNFNI